MFEIIQELKSKEELEKAFYEILNEVKYEEYLNRMLLNMVKEYHALEFHPVKGIDYLCEKCQIIKSCEERYGSKKEKGSR